MIAIVRDEEIQRIGYYAVIPATVLFNERLKPNEKLLYALITALSNKEGYCYASNKYLGEKLGVDPVTVSRWITDLRRNNYVFVDIMRNEKKEIICRRIFPNDVPYRLNNQYPYILKNQEGIDEKVKDNNIIDNNINTHTVSKEKFNENVFLYDYEYKKLLEEYIDFLKGLFKGSQPSRYIALAYLTGILPIKRTMTQSALNNFDEYTMLNPGPLASFIGFTEGEVKGLSNKYNIDFDRIKKWYDGYYLNHQHVYNPKAVVSLFTLGVFQSYWAQTSSYESIHSLIQMNFDGLKEAVLEMLSGNEVKMQTTSFQNDMISFKNMDDVLTALVHLGYLGYNQTYKTVFIPNEEIRQEFVNSVSEDKWNDLIQFEKESDTILEATCQMKTEVVAKQMEKIHNTYASNIAYHNENSLSSVLTIAYLSTLKYYFKPIRELPTGRGFADFVYIPKPEYKDDYPALLVELKWNHNVQSALDQIKEKVYPQSIQEYTNNLLLVGITYDPKTKEHRCKIEKF